MINSFGHAKCSIRNSLVGALLLLNVSPSVLVAEGDHDGYFSIGVGEPSFTFEIDRKPTDADSSEANLGYMPNLPLTASAEFSIYGVTLGAGFDIPGTKDSSVDTSSNGAKVKTDYTNYSASYFFENVGLSGSLTTLQGMNIDSVSGVSSDILADDENTHRSDIELTDQGANIWVTPLAYNFSLRDFFGPASKPRGSGIALVAVGSYDLLSVGADKALVPEGYRTPFGDDQTFMSGSFESMNVHFGPAFVVDFSGVYLSGLVTLGSGSQKATYINEGREEQTTKRTSDKTYLYLASGYKGEKIFTCLEYSMESPGYNLKTVTIATSRSNIRWITGFRF